MAAEYEGTPPGSMSIVGEPAVAAGRGGRAVVAADLYEFGPNTGRQSVGAQIQSVGPNGVPGPVTRIPVQRGFETEPKVAMDRHGTAAVVLAVNAWQGAIAVHDDQAPCPVERIGPQRGQQGMSPVFAGETGVAAWQPIPSSAAHMAIYSPRPGWCPPPLPPDPVDPPATAPALTPVPAPPNAATPRARTPRVGAIVRLDRTRRRGLVRLRCTRAAATPCAGRLALLGAKRARTAARPRLGRARFSLRSGASRTMRVRLSRKVQRRTRGRVRLEVAGRRTSERHVTLC